MHLLLPCKTDNANHYLFFGLQVLATSKIVITQSSYIPGQNFPEKEEDLNGMKISSQ